MSDSLDPRDDLTERLAALGRQPVDPALQSEHLTAMSSVASGRSFRTSLVGRLKVGAGVFAGFLLGASGLATVGGLGPLQPIVAERAAEVANVDLPQGPKDKAAKAAKAKAEKARLEDGSIGTQRQWANCEPGEDGKFAGNRGQYLKQERAKGAEAFQAAKDSLCGLPEGATKDGDDAATTEETEESKGQNGDAGKSNEEHGKKDAAPGQEGKDKGEPGDKAEGAGVENKPDTPAGPPAEGAEAGKSGITPPVTDPESQTPAQPETPAPEADNTSTDTDGEV